MYSVKNKNNSKKLILLFALAAVVILLGGFSVFMLKNQESSSANTKVQVSNPEAQVNLNPVSQQEAQQADTNKQQIIAREEAQKPASSPEPSTQSSNASITVVGSTSLSVKSYVRGIFEDGGTCTAVAIKGAETITKSSEGFKNVSNTQCSPINWDKPLSTGVWKVMISYKSATTQASTSTETIVK